MSYTKVIIAALLIGGLAWFVWPRGGTQPQQAKADSPAKADNPEAADFKSTDLDGREFDSSQLKGSAVVLDLWATWCEPCLADIPMFNKLHEKYESRGLKMVGVAMQSGWAADIKPHVEKHGMKYRIVVGNDEFAELYPHIGLPTTFLISKDWKIVKKYIGTLPGKEADKEKELEREIEKLLGTS
jgi:thiol-disulfide isomerase/thioredoxin